MWCESRAQKKDNSVSRQMGGSVEAGFVPESSTVCSGICCQVPPSCLPVPLYSPSFIGLLYFFYTVHTQLHCEAYIDNGEWLSMSWASKLDDLPIDKEAIKLKRSNDSQHRRLTAERDLSHFIVSGPGKRKACACTKYVQASTASLLLL